MWDTLFMDNETTKTETHYDYDLQCYVVNGVIAKCGHIEPAQGCYACAHAGEKV